MAAEDRDALVCDMAETYRIFSAREHPLPLIATLAAGLRENSRIRMKMGGQVLGNTESMLALILDKVNLLWWSKTKDAEHKRNRPESIYAALTTVPKEKEEIAFDTPDDFEMRRRMILGE